MLTCYWNWREAIACGKGLLRLVEANDFRNLTVMDKDTFRIFLECVAEYLELRQHEKLAYFK